MEYHSKNLIYCYIFRVPCSAKQKGFTLVELVVVIFVIGLLAMILISDFPKIQKQFALSRVAYKLEQDLRRAEDLGLSGVKLTNKNGDQIRNIKGYGVYFNLTQSTTKYIIYADMAGPSGSSDRKYGGNFSSSLCSVVSSGTTSDCVIEIVDLRDENSSLFISGLTGISGSSASINFSPPNPTTTITPASSSVGIVLENDLGLTPKTVWVNTSGLIKVQVDNF